MSTQSWEAMLLGFYGLALFLWSSSKFDNLELQWSVNSGKTSKSLTEHLVSPLCWFTFGQFMDMLLFSAHTTYRFVQVSNTIATGWVILVVEFGFIIWGYYVQYTSQVLWFSEWLCLIFLIVYIQICPAYTVFLM